MNNIQINNASMSVTPFSAEATVVAAAAKKSANSEHVRLMKIMRSKERQLATKRGPKADAFKADVSKFNALTNDSWRAMCAANDAFNHALADELAARLMKLGGGSIWLTGYDLTILNAGGYAVRCYEGTFGQTSAGCHSVSKWALSQHGCGGSNTCLVQFSIDAAMSQEGYDYNWVKILLKKEHHSFYLEQPRVISMDADNRAYQDYLMHG